MKHTVKRTTAAILAALILAGTAAAAATFAAPTIAHATEPLPATSGDCGATEDDNVTWSYDGNGTLTISGTGDMKGYNIINGVAQNLPWENYRTSIEKVVIESEITEIGFGSFAGCTNLTEVIFAKNSNLEKIGSNAFDRCTSLTTVTIPEGVTSIGSSAFYGCTGLTSVTIPEDVTSISQDVFYGCTGLTSVTIPKSVASIGDGVFYDCTSLTTVVVERTTPQSLEEHVFDKTPENLKILVPAGRVDAYKQAWNKHADKIQEIPNGYCGAENNTGGVESVKWVFNPTTGTLTISGTGAMADCGLWDSYTADTPWKNYKNDIKKIVIGKEITSIGTYNFALLPNLENITFEENSELQTIGGFAFYNSGFTNITIPANVTAIDVGVFNSCRLTEVTFAKNSKLERIGTTAFAGCRGLTSIALPSSVTSIENEAFRYCAKLTTVTMERSTPPTLGDNIFESCEELNTIFVPVNALTRYQKDWSPYKRKLAIGGFCGADGHESDVTWKLQNGTLTISGTGAMADYSYYQAPWNAYRDTIETVVIEDGVTSIGQYAFYACTSLASITIPKSVTSIGEFAFNNCKALENIDLPEELTKINRYAFAQSGLTSVTIPANVKEISEGAFKECTALENVILSENITLINEDAFNGCQSLETIIFPEVLTTIHQNAFAASGLTGVTIPKSVDLIGIGAFSVCEHLDSVIMERETPCAVGPNIFGDENPGSLDTRSKFVKENTKGITVPYGSLSAYRQANGWDTYKDYMKEAPNPNPSYPVTGPITIQKPTIIDEDGNVITGSITYYPDGSVVDTTIVTKPNGDTTTTVVEKDPQGNTTKTTETKVETAADGTKTETETVTETGKAPVITKTVTKKDGSQTIEKITSAENSRGNTVTTTETTVKDSKGNVVKKTTKKEIKNIGNGTDAVIDVDNNTAIINKIGAAKPKGMQATINNKVLSQLKEANNGKNLLLTMIVKDKDGNKRYSVEVNTADLTPKNELYIYKKDSKTGELYMVNGKAYIPDSKGQLKLIIRSKGDFVLKNAEDAAKINERILATVQTKKNKATLAKGKTELFAFHEDLDMRNVKSISYESSDPRIATVNETGKIKGKKAGTTTITATVTHNGVPGSYDQP